MLSPRLSRVSKAQGFFHNPQVGGGVDVRCGELDEKWVRAEWGGRRLKLHESLSIKLSML